LGVFPYRKDFEPIVQTQENIRPIGIGVEEKFYVVKHIEPIQPFIVDFCGSDFLNGDLPAHGNSGYATKFYAMKEEFALPKNTLGQFRIELLDDILIKVSHIGAAAELYGLKYTDTYLTKEKPRHTVFKRQTSTDTEQLVWKTTNVSEAGRRKARIVKLWITNESGSAGEVRFGDGDGTGTNASSTSASMSFRIGAYESVGFNEDELPEVEFLTGITWQTSVQPVRITVTIEEDMINPFKDNHNREIFVLEDNYPYMKVVNPLAIAQSTARILVAGYKFFLAEIPRPAKWTDIPVSRMPQVK